MQGNQARMKQVPSQSKQDLAKCKATKPKLNKALAKVNKSWAKCTANQAKVKQGPSQSKQDLG